MSAAILRTADRIDANNKGIKVWDNTYNSCPLLLIKMVERRGKMEILIEKTDYEPNEAGCSGWDDCSSVTYD